MCGRGAGGLDRYHRGGAILIGSGLICVGQAAQSRQSRAVLPSADSVLKDSLEQLVGNDQWMIVLGCRLLPLHRRQREPVRWSVAKQQLHRKCHRFCHGRSNLVASSLDEVYEDVPYISGKAAPYRLGLDPVRRTGCLC